MWLMPDAHLLCTHSCKLNMLSGWLLRLQVLLVCPGASTLAAEMEALQEAHGAVTASGRPHAVVFATQRVGPLARPLCCSPSVGLVLHHVHCVDFAAHRRGDHGKATVVPDVGTSHPPCALSALSPLFGRTWRHLPRGLCWRRSRTCPRRPQHLPWTSATTSARRRSAHPLPHAWVEDVRLGLQPSFGLWYSQCYSLS